MEHLCRVSSLNPREKTRKDVRGGLNLRTNEVQSPKQSNNQRDTLYCRTLTASLGRPCNSPPIAIENQKEQRLKFGSILWRIISPVLYDVLRVAKRVVMIRTMASRISLKPRCEKVHDETSAAGAESLIIIFEIKH